jgi:hypothetical protein
MSGTHVKETIDHAKKLNKTMGELRQHLISSRVLSPDQAERSLALLAELRGLTEQADGLAEEAIAMEVT